MPLPPPVFYPSLVVNFRIRFEQAAIGPPEPTPQAVPDSPQAFAQSIGLSIQDALSGQADEFSQVFAIVPKRCTVELPAYAQAGKFTLGLEFRDFPFDPRAVRALGIDIHLGAVSESDFADGMNRTAPPGFQGQSGGDRLSSVLNPTDDNLLIRGFGDTITTDSSEQGYAVQIEGRDRRGVLLDLKVRPEVLRNLDLTKPLNEVIDQILHLCPLLKDFATTFFPQDWDNGVPPSPAVKGDLTRVQLGAGGQQPSVQTSAHPDSLGLWDIIIQYCYILGVVPYFIGPDLIIRPARNLYDQKLNEATSDPARNFETPFAGGTPRQIEVVTGSTRKFVPIKYRRMVFGHNISKLKIERKLSSAAKVPVVECVSVDTSNAGRGAKNRLISARWPDNSIISTSSSKSASAKVTTVSPSGAISQEEVLRFTFPGVKSKNRLQQLARQLREQIGRQEVGGSCSTKDLTSFGGSNGDPDLLSLRPGDAVEILANANAPFGNPPVVSEVTNQAAMTEMELAKTINDRINDKNAARVLARTLKGSIASLQTTFRVGNVKYSWEAGDGIGIDFDFQNYVELRYDVENTSSPVAATPSSKSTTTVLKDPKTGLPFKTSFLGL